MQLVHQAWDWLIQNLTVWIPKSSNIARNSPNF